MQINGTQIPSFFSLLSLEKPRKVAAEGVPETPRPTPGDLLSRSHLIVTKKVPSLESTGPLSLFRAADAVRLLSQREAERKIPAVDDLDQKPRFGELRLSRLQDLRDSLEGLSGTVAFLRDEESFNTHSAESTKPSLVDVAAGRNSPVTAFSTFTVEPKRVASQSTLTSDFQSEPIGALGVTGSFFINGFEIKVEASDSIFSLRDKINFGEDTNKNRTLDLAEDMNGNGIADVTFVDHHESGAGVFITEDLNGNGILDSSEDANLNGRLDGGTLENKVVARVKGNRLELTGTAGGSTRIDLRDADNILLSLGFFERNSKGMPIQKEIQFNSANPPVNLNVEPSKSEIAVEGETLTGNTNIFSGAIEDTALEIRRASEKTAEISISIDSAKTVGLIKTFAVQFNKSIGIINDVLSQSLTFDKDPGIQDLRKDLIGDSAEQIGALARRNQVIDGIRGTAKNLQEVGIQTVTAKSTIQEPTIPSLQSIRKGLISPFQGGEAKLLNRLSRIGIRTLEDATLKIDENKLTQALKDNFNEIDRLFNDPQKGLLPVLGNQLSRILQKGLGDLDLKRDEISLRSQIPNELAERYKRFQENSALGGTVQNLITVV